MLGPAAERELATHNSGVTCSFRRSSASDVGKPASSCASRSSSPGVASSPPSSASCDGGSKFSGGT